MGPVVLGMSVFLPAKGRFPKGNPKVEMEAEITASLLLGREGDKSQRWVVEHPSPQYWIQGMICWTKWGNSE